MSRPCRSRRNSRMPRRPPSRKPNPGSHPKKICVPCRRAATPQVSRTGGVPSAARNWMAWSIAAWPTIPMCGLRPFVWPRPRRGPIRPRAACCPVFHCRRSRRVRLRVARSVPCRRAARRVRRKMPSRAACAASCGWISGASKVHWSSRPICSCGVLPTSAITSSAMSRPTSSPVMSNMLR